MIELARQIAEGFAAQADRLRGSPMMVDDVRVVRGEEIRERWDAVGEQLRRRGVGPGSRVGIVAAPPVEFVVDLMAVLGLGGTVVPLPGDATPSDLVRTHALTALTHLLGAVGPDRVVGTRTDDLLGRRLEWDPERARIDDDGPGSLQLTSGTTGRQSVARRPVTALAAEIGHYRDALDLDRRSRLASAVPLNHAYGFGLCALAGPLAGAVVHFVRPERPRALLRGLDEATSLLVSVPPMLRTLATVARADGVRPGLSCVTAGMTLDAHTARTASDHFGGGIAQVYGTTETGPICIREPVSWERAVRSLGPPLPDVTVDIDTDNDTNNDTDRTAPDGSDADPAVGTVAVRSPSMMRGYLAPDGVDASAVASGRFTTGDLARWTPEGLTLVGRTSTCINVAGVKVSPEEVESVLLESPAVRSALVIAEPDERTGERVRAIVTPDDVAVDELVAHCAARLRPSHRPREYATVAALPTTGTGKVIRPSRPTAGPSEVEGASEA